MLLNHSLNDFFVISLLLLLIALVNFFFSHKVIYGLSKIMVFSILCIFYGKGVLKSHDSVIYYIPFYLGDSWRTFEPLYTLINIIGNKLELTPQQFLFGVSSISLLIFLICLENILSHRKLYFFAVFILFTTLSFNFIFIGLLRQSIALGLLSLAIYFYINEKRLKTILLILMASLMHYYSILLFLIFILEKLKLNKQKIILIVMLLITISVTSTSFLYDLITSFLLNIIPDGNFVQTLQRVSEYSKHNIKHDNYIFKYLASVMSFVALILVYYFISNRNKTMDKMIVILTSILIAVSVMYFAHETSIRILYIFNIFSVWSWTELFFYARIKGKSLLLIPIGIGFLIYSFISHDWISQFINRII